jgi:glucosyl-dolichyl phosphate glucuronosyltransferase
MLASVAICTLNRAGSLRRTLESLSAMRVPDALEWEVLVVNNGCADRTDEIIDSFAPRLPIRRELEMRRGLSRARNRVIECARGDYIMWTDDDVAVEPGWLAAYLAAIRRWPSAAVFGGPIVPRLEEPSVQWVAACQDLLRSPYAFCDFGVLPVQLSMTEGRIPFGANFVVRAAEQRRFRYDPELGMAPGQERLGEETAVIGQILGSGATGYWIPNARLDHWIDHRRQTAAYIIRYFAAQGETRELFRKSVPAGPLWLGVPRRVLRRFLKDWIRYRFHRLFSPARVWITHLQNYGRSKGAFRYWWKR